MKFTVIFKTPDALDFALKDIEEERMDECKELAEKFIKYNEYIKVEFDTEAKTATVLPT